MTAAQLASAASSPPPPTLRPALAWARSPSSCAPTRPRSQRCWRKPRLNCWPSTPSPPSTTASCAPPTPGAGQPRDRPALRCRGDLPQRRRAAAACRHAPAGAKRRVAGRPPLPLGVLDGSGRGHRSSCPVRHHQQPPGGGPAHRSLSSMPSTRVTSYTTKCDLTMSSGWRKSGHSPCRQKIGVGAYPWQADASAPGLAIQGNRPPIGPFDSFSEKSHCSLRDGSLKLDVGCAWSGCA
jgi:hypothetical protein